MHEISVDSRDQLKIVFVNVIMATMLRRIVLFHLLNIVRCISSNQFYTFGEDSMEANTRLGIDNDGSEMIFQSRPDLLFLQPTTKQTNCKLPCRIVSGPIKPGSLPN